MAAILHPPHASRPGPASLAGANSATQTPPETGRAKQGTGNRTGAEPFPGDFAGKTLPLLGPQNSPGPALPLAPTLNLSVNSRSDPNALPTPNSLSWLNLSEVGFVP